MVGVDQFNYRIPDTVREGCAVPLQISTSDGISQPVTVSIRNGGGACVDPPPAAYGQIVWEMRLPLNYGVYRAERVTPPLVRKIGM